MALKFIQCFIAAFKRDSRTACSKLHGEVATVFLSRSPLSLHLISKWLHSVEVRTLWEPGHLLHCLLFSSWLKIFHPGCLVCWALLSCCKNFQTSQVSCWMFCKDGSESNKVRSLFSYFFFWVLTQGNLNTIYSSWSGVYHEPVITIANKCILFFSE